MLTHATTPTPNPAASPLATAASPSPALHSEQVLESDISRPQSDSDGTEPKTEYFLFPNAAPDWPGLLRYHRHASRDPARPPRLRRWHADQVRRVKAHMPTPAPVAWSWEALCAQWRGERESAAAPLT